MVLQEKKAEMLSLLGEVLELKHLKPLASYHQLDLEGELKWALGIVEASIHQWGQEVELRLA